MKNRVGLIIGFIIGFASFLLLFKIFMLENIPKDDEVPPGLVLIAAIGTGGLFAFLGNWIQKNVRKSGN